MRRLGTIAILVGTASWPAPAFAYRPFDATDGDVAPLHRVELELGPVQYLQADKQRFLALPQLVANFGIIEGWELVFEGRNQVRIGSSQDESRVHFVDAGLSMKGLLRSGCLQGESGLSIATELGALFPAAGEEAGFGATASLFLSQRWDFGTAHLNGGIAWTRRNDASASGGFIVEGPIVWPLRPVAEGLFEREFGVTTLYTGLVGVILRLSDDLSLDAAVRRGKEGDATLTEVRAGFTWSFEP